MDYRQFIKNTIVKNYKENNREKTWNEIYDYIHKKQLEIEKRWERYKRWYSKTHERMDYMRDVIENEYESYFCFYNRFWQKAWYDRVNGNQKLKDLLINQK